MEIELIEAWIEMNAPESIRKDLIRGIHILDTQRIQMDIRREKYPNEGMVFSDQEAARIMELNNELNNYATRSWERDREIEQEFGRPLKSILGKLRRMNAKGA